MQCSEPEMRHFLQITLCNKASHFSILKKTSKYEHAQFQSGLQRSVSFTIFKGLYHSPFSKVCIIHHFQSTGSKFITKEVIRQVARYNMAV